MNTIYKFEKEHGDNWMIDISGQYTQTIKNYLSDDGIPEDGINEIVLNAAKVLGYCPNPQGPASQKTGIVIGKVQSGKTSNFITTISLAFDNGYDVVVVLGGTKRNLVAQNKERIEEYFKEISNKVIIFDTETNSNQINEKDIKKHVINGKKIIIVSLKSKRMNLIHENLFFKHSYFADKPILIIDDEGDEYSLNNMVKKGKKSTTYKYITDLLQDLNKRAFISVTATPQANLIISTVDVLSPDFGVLVYPGEGYCGLDVFHQDNSPYCVEIPDYENSLLEDGIPSSFYDALSMYFVASAIYKRREVESKRFSMLIHPSWKVDDLTAVYDKTKRIIEYWTHLVENKDDISFQSLKDRLEKAYNSYKKDGVEVGELKNVLDEACSIITYTGIHLITGNNQLANNDKPFENNIYIGGQMVGRGLTIKGLAITYIIRTAKGVSNVDTVEQRARWFGYKESILDLCRIYATEKIISEFSEIRIHEEEVWELIEKNNSNGTNFKDIKRMFVLGERLKMTRTSVGKVEKKTFNLRNIENKFETRPEIIENNKKIIDELKEKYSDKIEKDIYGVGKDTFHSVVRNISFSTLFDQDLRDYRSPLDSTCSNEFISQLSSYINKYLGDVKCDLVWMRDGRPSKHEIKSDGIIPNYMVGRRPKNLPIDQCIYKGDREYYRESVITVQIHNIMNINNNVCCPTLAIYIPYPIACKLKNIVVPEN